MEKEQLLQLAEQSITSLLESLNYEFSLEITDSGEGFDIMIASPQAKYLIGENGDRLDDLQYLVNRMIQKECESAPRVRVDCDSYRARSEEKLLQRARARAQRVLESGAPVRMEPLNAYQRRLVHNALAEIEGVGTSSEDTDSRFKRIIINKV